MLPSNQPIWQVSIRCRQFPCVLHFCHGQLLGGCRLPRVSPDTHRVTSCFFSPDSREFHWENSTKPLVIPNIPSFQLLSTPFNQWVSLRKMLGDDLSLFFTQTHCQLCSLKCLAKEEATQSPGNSTDHLQVLLFVLKSWRKVSELHHSS